MEYKTLNEATPYVGQYAFIKDGDTRSLAMWHPVKGFIFIYGKVVRENISWCPAYLKGSFRPLGMSGELDFVPTEVVDEEGNVWNG